MVTQVQIQSMVDGEFSHEERATLLREIESEPDNWRALALALLEEQEWSRQISSSAKRNSQNLSPSTMVTSSFQGLVSSEPVKPMLRVASLDQLGGATGEKSGKRLASWGSVLAACFLLGVGIYGGSFLPGTNSLKSNDLPELVAVDGAKRNVEESPIDGRLESNMGMLVSGPNREREEIPIYDLNAIDHEVFVAREKYELAKINQRLRKEGFELDVRPEYYMGKLNDGRQLIVPVKHVGLKPFGL